MTSWEGVETSGLPDDIDFTIDKAEFGYDAAYNDGEQILFIITARETDDNGNPYRSFYSLGRAGAWETLDHGKTVVSQSSPPASGFNKQSLYFKFFDAAARVASEGGVNLASFGNPDSAAIFEGLTFHMNRVDVDYGGEIGSKKVLLPTRLVSGKAESPQQFEAAAPVAEPAPTTPGGGGATTNIAEVKVKNLLAQNPGWSHDEFIEGVLTVMPEVQNDVDLMGRILDEKAIYSGN